MLMIISVFLINNRINIVIGFQCLSWKGSLIFWSKNELSFGIYFIDSFRTALDVDDNNATNKMCDSVLTKRNDSGGFWNALIGLAIVASLITFIYLYTYLLEKHRTRPLTVNVSVWFVKVASNINKMYMFRKCVNTYCTDIKVYQLTCIQCFSK